MKPFLHSRSLLTCPERSRRVAYCLLLLTFFCIPSHSLPKFQKLFEARYGYQANCSLCHVNRGKWNRLNVYGTNFLKHDRVDSAFEQLEAADFDKDGLTSLEEIEAKSNPGDPKSTNKKLGRWLKRNMTLKTPRKWLTLAFPDATRFDILGRSLTNPEITRVKKSLESDSWRASDASTLLYIARNTKGVIGAGGYIDVLEDGVDGKELHVFFAAINPNGKILRLFNAGVERRQLKKGAFLRRFRSLWPEDLDRMKFSRKYSQDLMDSLKNELAKIAYIVDAVIPP